MSIQIQVLQDQSLRTRALEGLIKVGDAATARGDLKFACETYVRACVGSPEIAPGLAERLEALFHQAFTTGDSETARKAFDAACARFERSKDSGGLIRLGVLAMDVGLEQPVPHPFYSALGVLMEHNDVSGLVEAGDKFLELGDLAHASSAFATVVQNRSE